MVEFLINMRLNGHRPRRPTRAKESRELLKDEPDSETAEFSTSRLRAVTSVLLSGTIWSLDERMGFSGEKQLEVDLMSEQQEPVML